MRPFVFLISCLTLAYGAIAIIDESDMSQLTREVLEEKRTRSLNPQEAIGFSHTLTTWAPGSITLLYDPSKVAVHDAVGALTLKADSNVPEFVVTHVAPNSYQLHMDIALPSSIARDLDPDTLVAAFSRGSVSVSYHKDMERGRATQILKDLVESMNSKQLLREGDNSHNIAVHHNGRMQFEQLS